MPFNINSFKSNVKDYGYLKTNLFEVYINPPRILLGKMINNTGTEASVKAINDMQRFRIDQVRAPGISLASADVSRNAVGPTQKQPYNAQYSELSFSILCDAKGFVWHYWYNWLNSIFEFNAYEDSNLAVINQLPSYASEYKDNYATTMQIVIYNQTGGIAQRINILEAFPTALREVAFAWGDNGNMVKINVSISYSYYTMVATNIQLPA
jgi:hypothetical protein